MTLGDAKWSPLQIMHGSLGLKSLVCGCSPDAAWLLPCLTDFFFFSFPFFFFSITWLLASLFSPSEEEEGEGEKIEEGDKGSTSVSTSHWFNCWGVMAFWTTEVENSHTGGPIVIPGRDNVAIYGAPIFSKEENGLGFPSRVIPWLVDSINSTKDQRRNRDVIPN